MRSTIIISVLSLVALASSVPLDIEARANGMPVVVDNGNMPVTNPSGSNVAGDGTDEITPDRFGRRPGQDVYTRPAGDARGGDVTVSGSSITNNNANKGGDGANSRSGNAVAY
ncbi:hypothetical protein ABKN59_009183 [Abortiporus biennis]